MSKITQRVIFNTWWPLAASWLLMSAEGPVLNGFVARMPEPEINLAASGGIIMPIAFIIEAPIIMLLSASTALGKDWISYLKLRKFMLVLGGAITLLQTVIAFTPIYDFIANSVMGIPQELVEPGRIGLRIMIPWSFFIGLRRFNQGLMIRHGRSDAVAKTSIVRLVAVTLIMSFGFWFLPGIPGVILMCIAQVVSVTLEASYAVWMVQPVLRLLRTLPEVEPLRLKPFLSFYIPLVLTSLLGFLAQPIGSSMISRMPNPVESLAIWAVMGNLIFILRSPGISFNEVVVALLDEKGSSIELSKFGRKLTLILFGIAVLFTFTPLSEMWFGTISGLTPHLAELAKRAMLPIIIIPPLGVLQSWFQGNLVFSRKTTGITEAVIAFVITLTGVLMGGVVLQTIPGVYVAATAFASANFMQAFWMWFRSRATIKAVHERDLPYHTAGAAKI